MIFLESLTAKLGVKTDRRSFGEADKLLSGLKSAAVKLGAAFAAVKVARTVASWVTDTTNGASATLHLAQALDISSDKLQELEFAAVAAGGSSEALTATIRTLARNLQAAATDGASPVAASLRKLGVTSKQIRARDTVGALNSIADALATGRLKGKGELAHVMASLGDESVKLLPSLRGGSKGLKQLADQAREAGAIIDGETLEQFDALAAKNQRLEASFTAVKRAVALALLPAITAATDRALALAREYGGPVAAALKRVGAVVLPLAEVIRRVLVASLRAVGGVVASIVRAIRGLGSALKGSAVVTANVSRAWGVARAALSTWVAAAKAVWAAISAVGTVLVAIAKIVYAVVKAIVTLADKMGLLALIAGVIKTAYGLLQWVFETLAKVVRGLADVVEQLGDLGAAAADQIGERFHTALDWIVDTITAIKEGFAALPNALGFSNTEEDDVQVRAYNRAKQAGLNDLEATSAATAAVARYRQAQPQAGAPAVAPPAAPPEAIDLGPWGPNRGSVITVSAPITVTSTAPAADVADAVNARLGDAIRRAAARAP